MSRGINKVIIVGNLGSDPDSRSFPDGGMVSNISVATSDVWRDRNTGEMQERTEWHRVVLRDRGNYRLGQIAQQYLRKGSKVYIEGSLRTRKYTDNQGQERYITEIIADQMQMLDSRQASQADGYAAPYASPQAQQSYQSAPAAPAPQTSYQQPPAQNQPPAAPVPQPAPQSQPEPPFAGNDFDDDIPF